MNHLEFIYADERLTLFAEKAVFWNRTETLIIADPHFGKAAAFRHAGIPVPENVTANDLCRLDSLLNFTHSKRLFILGDFFHARTGRSEAMMHTLGQWCETRRTLEIWLMPGNHDKSSGAPPECWNMQSVDELIEGPFAFRHEPVPRHKLHVLAGHLHPCICVGDKVGSGLRAPCFWFGENSAVLPSFGSFTGSHPIEARNPDKVFAIAKGEVFEIPAVLLRD